MKIRPTGEIEVLHIIPGDKSTMIASGTVVCVDAAGDKWQFPAAYMAHEMSPYAESQTLNYTDWYFQLNKASGYWNWERVLATLNKSDLVKAYRDGMSPEQATTYFCDNYSQSIKTK